LSQNQITDDSATGISISGSARDGQEVTLSREDMLKQIFGTRQPDIANAMLIHCLRVLGPSEASDEHPSQDQRQFMVAAVMEMEPRDTFERLLAVQMAATHVALIRTGERLAHADQLPQYEAHERVFNKLARTYTRQMDTLRKHRNGGKQTVTVQHVTVSDGGQAVVGTVRTGGRVSDET
jgi:hypothetical protein